MAGLLQISRAVLRSSNLSTGILRCAAFSTVDGQYSGPSMKTEVPGPRSKVSSNVDSY